MSSTDVLDFFSSPEYQDESFLEKDFSSEDLSSSDKNLNVQTGKNENSRIQAKKYSGDFSSDDRIVWVTAVFIFFGIMVFLLGYWLGKMSVKEIVSKEKEILSEKRAELEEKKVESFVIFSSSSKEAPVIVQEAVKEKPLGNISEKNEEKPAPIDTKKTEAASSSSRNISFTREKQKGVEVKKPKEVLQQTPSYNEKYSIQVSAHTSMEKARLVEEEMRKLGFHSYLVEATVNGVTYYRVRVGKFNSKDEAENALRKIKTSPYGNESFLIRLE